MAIRTQKQPVKTIEVFDDRDRAEIHEIITNLHQSYVDRLHEATLELHRAQRQVNRAGHEVSRLQSHIERIQSFVTKNDIPLNGEGSS